MTAPTATEVARAQTRMALVTYPGTAQQRALETVDSDRVDQMTVALTRAHTNHPGVPLGWLHHATGAVVPIIP